MELLLRGLLIGFSIAAPVGPIGVLCIRRTLAFGRLSGFVSGLGAATADGLYGSIAVMGLTIVSSFLIGHQDWLQFVGGAFLLFLGIKTWAEKPAIPIGEQGQERGDWSENRSNTQEKEGSFRKRMLNDYTSTFFLTLTNPLTILSFTAVFAGLGLGSAGEAKMDGLILVWGVFMGSAAWWWLLSMVTDAFRARFLTKERLRWVNRISGAIILAFGVLAIAGIIIQYLDKYYTL